MNVSVCYTANTGVSIRRSPLKIVAYEFVLTSPASPECLVRLTRMVCEIGSKWPYSCCFVFLEWFVRLKVSGCTTAVFLPRKQCLSLHSPGYATEISESGSQWVLHTKKTTKESKSKINLCIYIYKISNTIFTYGPIHVIIFTFSHWINNKKYLSIYLLEK